VLPFQDDGSEKLCILLLLGRHTLKKQRLCEKMQECTIASVVSAATAQSPGGTPTTALKIILVGS